MLRPRNLSFYVFWPSLAGNRSTAGRPQAGVIRGSSYDTSGMEVLRVLRAKVLRAIEYYILASNRSAVYVPVR